MVKRVVVAGSRNYHNYQEAKIFIDFCVQNIRKEYVLVFVSGGCRGADLLGERYAAENGFQIQRYHADWERFGKGAGPKRNLRMAEVGDYIICFWDGYRKGTQSMIQYASQMGKPLRVRKISCSSFSK